MSFSADENYLFFYCQSIDQDQVPNNRENGTFKIWDILNNKQIVDLAVSNKSKSSRQDASRKEEGGKKEIGRKEEMNLGQGIWGKRNFPNSLNCDWQLYQSLTANEDDIYKENE
jgi:hypothetical protein